MTWLGEHRRQRRERKYTKRLGDVRTGKRMVEEQERKTDWISKDGESIVNTDRNRMEESVEYQREAWKRKDQSEHRGSYLVHLCHSLIELISKNHSLNDFVWVLKQVLRTWLSMLCFPHKSCSLRLFPLRWRGTCGIALLRLPYSSALPQTAAAAGINISNRQQSWSADAAIIHSNFVVMYF